MTQDTEVVVYTDKMKSPEPLTFEDIRRNTKLVKKALKEVMVKGADYGTVPGCGDKLGLFKAGAEKLMLLFKLGCFPEVQKLHDDPDALEFIVKTRIVHIPSGLDLGIGLGSSSSNEEKYKWRGSTKKEFDGTPEERRRIKYYKGDYDKKTKKYGPEREAYQVRTNPADLNNTLLKMACKRSKVDGVITVTGASDIFTQDMEDDGVPTIQTDESPIKKPQARGEGAKSENVQETAQELKSEPIERAVPTGFRAMKARYNGICPGCGSETKIGAEILYNDVTKKAYHADCL